MASWFWARLNSDLRLSISVWSPLDCCWLARTPWSLPSSDWRLAIRLCCCWLWAAIRWVSVWWRCLLSESCWFTSLMTTSRLRTWLVSSCTFSLSSCRHTNTHTQCLSLLSFSHAHTHRCRLNVWIHYAAYYTSLYINRRPSGSLKGSKPIDLNVC